MAFVVEDGTGLTTSNAYCTVAFFRGYHDDRGNSTVAYPDSQIQIAIIKATDYIDNRFRTELDGYRQNVDQALEFPRFSLYYRDGRIAMGIPPEVQKAACEYGYRALSSELTPDPTYDDTNAPIVEREEQVGPIKERFVFAAGGATASFRKYPLADRLLREFTIGGRELRRV